MDPQHRIGFKDAYYETWPLRISKRSVLFNGLHLLLVCLATIICIMIDTVYYMNNIRLFCHFNIRNITRLLARQIMAPKIATKGIGLTQEQHHTIKRHSYMNLLNIAILYRIPVWMDISARIHHEQKQK